MNNSDDPSLSRRKLFELVSASVGAGLIGVRAATAEAQAVPPSDRSHTLGGRTYNVRDFGAKGDGVTLDTAALQQAINDCHREQGGTVLVPAGVFVIGSVELKSNVTLELAAQAKLLGSSNGAHYHAADKIPLSGDSTLNDGNVGLIFAVEAENVSIVGQGTIDGQGSEFRSPMRGAPPPSGRGGAERPYHLLFYHCRNLTVRDITLVNSAFHSIRVIQSHYVKMEGLHIHNRVNHNNDGFHFISCEYVHVSDCDVESQDDACALFGSCKFVTVTGCSFSTRWSVFRFGGGVAENIAVSNCLIYQTYGCPIKLRCSPGSRFENMSFSNLVMNQVTGPISIGCGPQTRPNGEFVQPQDESPGIVRNISFTNIRATVVVPQPLPEVPFESRYNPGEIKSCIALNRVGSGNIIENISFDNVHVTFPGGGTAEEAALRDLPTVVGEYYQTGVLPAYGLYARGVRRLTLKNVRFDVAASELRPAVVFDHVEDAAVNGFSAQGNSQAESLVRFISTREVLLSASRVLAAVPAFLELEGADCGEITIDGGDLSKAQNPLLLRQGAQQQAVKLRI
jgi:polygalacturonase